MPRYSRRPILTTSISVRDFRKFTFTTSKKDRDFVVYHKGLSFVVNATRRDRSAIILGRIGESGEILSFLLSVCSSWSSRSVRYMQVLDPT